MTGMTGRRERHHAPPAGEGQPLSPRRPRGPKRPKSRQAGGGSGFVNVNNRLFAPLQGLNPDNILQGGYGWLDKTDGGMTYHPGMDLNSGGSCNADEGLAVVAPLAGLVRAVLFWNGSSQGEGNHVWVELDDPCLPGPTWWHTDHLQRIDVGVGQRLPPGGAIGTCGRTGGWDCAHAHTELLTGPPKDGWWQWPYGWSRASVEAAYWSPNSWWYAAKALVLAEGGEPVPPEAVKAMTDWEIINWVLRTLYEWQNLSSEFNPDSGVCKAWVAALRAGHYPGRPRTGERPYGDPGAGVWQECEQQLLIWTNDGTASWTG